MRLIVVGKQIFAKINAKNDVINGNNDDKCVKEVELFEWTHQLIPGWGNKDVICFAIYSKTPDSVIEKIFESNISGIDIARLREFDDTTSFIDWYFKK